MRFTPQPNFDANAIGGDAFGDLPEWDLSDLYTATDAPEFKRDMDWLETACAEFASDYEGKLADLTPDGWLECILRYEKIDLIAGRIMSFVGLRYYQNTTDAERAAYARVESTVRLRRFGGDCYSYCMLAHGLTDLIIEAELAPYDVQGLIPVIEAAGGVITDWEGGSPAWGGRIVAAGDRRVHEAALELIAAA